VLMREVEAALDALNETRKHARGNRDEPWALCRVEYVAHNQCWSMQRGISPTST